MIENGDSAVLASFRLHRLYPVTTFVGSAFSAFAVMIVILAFVTDPAAPVPGLVFAPAAFAVVCLLFWRNLCLCYRLDLDERTLRWRAPARAGQARLIDLRAIRPSRLHAGVAVFEFIDGRRVDVYAKRGFVDFTARVIAVAPHVAVTTNGHIRFLQGLPTRNAFRSGRLDRV
jgi:hypothetical protein